MNPSTCQTKLLIDEPPLQVLPSLAVAVGLNEAIFLQQVHYWLHLKEKAHDPKSFHEGRWWVWNSYPDWKANTFPFWSVATIRRVIASLEKKGLLLAGNFNALAIDQTKWYTIDYEALRKWEVSRPSAQNEQMEEVNMSRPSAQNDQTITKDLSQDYSKTSLSEERDTASLPPEMVAWYTTQGLEKFLASGSPDLLRAGWKSCLAHEGEEGFPGTFRRVAAVLNGKFQVPPEDLEEREPEPVRMFTIPNVEEL